MAKRGNGAKRGRRANASGVARLLRAVARGAALLLIAALGYGGIVGGHSRVVGEAIDWAASTVGLEIRDVTVDGRKYTQPHQILGALGVARGDAITGFDPHAARERVIALRWVRDARVLRLYPDTIHVSIEEHQPFAVWRHGGKATLVDDQGIVVTGLDVAAFPELPVVVGAGAGASAPGFLATLRARPTLATRVSEAVRVGDRRWTLKLDNGIEVLLPDTGVEVALDALISIDERTGLLWRDIARIDMRLPDRLVVLPRADGEGDGEKDALAPTAAPREASA